MYKRIPKSLIVYFLFVFEDFFILRITEVFPLLDHTIGGYSGQCWGRTAFLFVVYNQIYCENGYNNHCFTGNLYVRVSFSVGFLFEL